MHLLLVLLAIPLIAAPNRGMLVSGADLATHLNDPATVILHVGSQADYETGHLPGARLVTLTDISVTGPNGLRLELPPVHDLEAAFGRLGISDTTRRIIVYAGNDSVQSATRVWFTLDYLGLGDRAALLDGGIAEWRAEKRPLNTDAPAIVPAAGFTAHPATQRVVTAEWVHSHATDRAVQILDARTPEFYSGANAGGMPRAGHIPDARSVPFTSLLQEHGKLKSPAALAHLLTPDPARAPAQTVSYCHIGQQATVLYFAARYLGLDAHLYDGSYQDWSRRTELPVRIDVADPGLASKIDALFTPLVEGNAPGFAVLVRDHGATIFDRGYGNRELRTSAKIDSHTNFRLASFTKQFTAAAIMLLVRDGKLRYSQTLTQIFPDFPAYGRSITIRNLLTHTGGLPDYENLMNDSWTPASQIQDAEVLDLLKRQTAGKFAPGSSWDYSNSGYVMLGLIVAKVSGEPFADFLRHRIFGPLHMDSTVLFVDGMNTVASRAYGHSKRAEGFEETDQSSTSATQGDGGIYSNLEDLAKWDNALESHKLLSAAEMREALTPVKLTGGAQPKWPIKPDDDNLAPGKPVAYGYGWFLDPLNERARMWHSGSTRGFSTVIERFTEKPLTVVVLSNRTDLTAEKLAQQIVALMK
jgi:CubicO group peptidase (beta-lactamase class C family)